MLIAGCGYLGLALGRHLAGFGHQVHGLRRSPDALDALRKAGIHPHAADLTRPETLRDLPNVWDAAVLCVAPSGPGESNYHQTYFVGARNLLEWLKPRPPSRLIFTSSTSVYPQNAGELIDEASPAEPASPTARILRQTEDLLLAAASAGFHVQILRAAGIYGPGRHRLDEARQGWGLPTPDPSRWMNFIHRDDLATAVVAAIERGRSEGVLNVSDDHPATAAEFTEWLERRVGVPQTDAPTGAGERRRTRAVTSKRIVARRLREELGWAPQYPDFRAGYESLLAAGE